MMEASLSFQPTKTQPIPEETIRIPEFLDSDHLKKADALDLLVREIDLLRAENERLRFQLLSLMCAPETGPAAKIVEFPGYPKMLVLFDERGKPSGATFLSEAVK